MSDTIFIDRRQDDNRRMRSMADGSVSEGMLHCRRRARDRRQPVDIDSSVNWWLNINYAVNDTSGVH
jgi:hypothetical protein